MKTIFSLFFALLLIISGVAAYNIDVTTVPERIVARDNPFAHYEGDLPSITVTVTDDYGQPANDATITLTVTHQDTLLLPTGFPWFEGAEVLSLSELSHDGTLTVDALLFPLRGDYTVDVRVMDTNGNTETEQAMISAAEPFKQSTLNGIIFVTVLVLFGAVVGWIFGKDSSFRSKGQSTFILMFVILLVSVFFIPAITIPVVFAHEGEEEKNYYQDAQITFYTSPDAPDIGQQTTFTFIVRDQNGQQVNNAVASIELANEEEDFTVLELELFSQTGTFTFNYGIFDGAPHIASLRVEPTTASTPQFTPITAEIPFAGVAHSPPLAVKIFAISVMLGAMLLGFAVGIVVRTMSRKKGETHE